MSDAVFVLVALGFFAICALYVRWCDSIVESGDDNSADDHADQHIDQRVES